MSRMHPPSGADDSAYDNDDRQRRDRLTRHKKEKSYASDHRRPDRDGDDASRKAAESEGLGDAYATNDTVGGSEEPADGLGRSAVHRVMTAVGMRRPSGVAPENFVPVHQRRGFKPLFFVIVLFLIIWLIPIIIGHSPLLNQLLTVGAGDLKGTVTIGSASLGWFSPVSLWNVEVRDARNEPVLVIPKATGDRSLIGILWDNSKLGSFRLEQPQVSVLFDQRGSNLEDMLAKYLARKEKSHRRYGVTLEIVDGTLFLRDCARNLACRLENLQLSVSNPAAPQQPLTVEAAGNLMESGHEGRSGRLTLSLEVGPLPLDGEEPSNSMRLRATGGVALPKTGRLKLGLESLPLAIWQSLAGRFTPITALDGRATGMVQVQWNGPASDKTKLDANLVADDFLLGARPLGRDQLHVRQLRSTCSIVWPAEEVRVNKWSVESELGTAALSGTFHVGKITARGVLEALHEQTYEVSSDIDLARLAQMLPDTLRIQRDTQVTAGRLVAVCNSRPGTEGGVLQARVEAGQVRAVQTGREIRWDQPIVLTLAAHEKYPALVIDNLNCQSSFLQMEGAGTNSHLTAAAHCDLDQLTGQLGQFVDLSGVRLTGQAWAKLDWQHRGRDGFTADATFQVRKLGVTLPQRAAWAESNYDARLTVSGLTDGPSIARVDSAVLSLETLADKLEARLLSPVADLRDGGTWPLEVGLSGKLDVWPQRLRPWMDLTDWRCSGQGQLAGQVVVSRGGLAAQSLKLTAAPLALVGPSAKINEPKVELILAGRWDRQSGRIDLDQATLSSSILSARLSEFSLATAQPDMPWSLAGLVQYDLEKISDLAQPYFGGKVRFVGRGTAPLTLRGSSDSERLEGEAGVSWTEGYVYGLRLGAAQLKGRLSGGQLRLDPLAVDASEGRIQLNSTLRLSPLELTVTPGMVAQQIRVDPATCEAMLKYIAPALADLSTAEGKFSIQLETCRIPLDDPGRGQLSGRLTIHSLQLSPGPLVTELANLMGRSGPVKMNQESVIPFQLRDRKIYHEGMELVFPDVTVRTAGWVGLDQTLAITAQMPVPQRWITDNALGATLKNQTITLPIAGTLHQLSVDPRALQEASRQFAQNAAGNVIQNMAGGALQNALGGSGQNAAGGLPSAVGGALKNVFGGQGAAPTNSAGNALPRQAEQPVNRQR